MRDGDWKLVRPMISGTRYFSKELYVSEEDELRTKAFTDADTQHKGIRDRLWNCCQSRE